MAIDFGVKNDDKLMFKIDLRLDSFVMELNHQSVTEIGELLNFMDNYVLALWIKKYLPRRRPITEDARSKTHKKTKYLVVRDWFQVVIWYNRMKKLKALQGYPKYYLNFSSTYIPF